MAEQLTTEQVLLLNNLMYMTDTAPLKKIDTANALTIGQFINKIDTDALISNKDYGSYMTGADWKDLIAAIKSDEQLMNLQIVETHIADFANGGGGGVSALFVNPFTNEAIVTFRGTAASEWKDNFIGGGPTDSADGVSTPYQENALDWYRSLNLDKYSIITVTGHSKGGNKAKYITVLDDSVDRCLAFDGQGFSDEFIEKYYKQIADNQDKIRNSNVEGDYVNILLNDIGNTTYYKGYDLGSGGFLENHCPNTYFNFDADGSFEMVEGRQDSRMVALDQFLNNYLRTLSAEDKQEILTMIGEMVQAGFAGENGNEILDILLKDNNVEHAANLVTYLLEYKKENPQLVESINEILLDMELDNVVEIVDVVVNITNWEHFDSMVDIAGGVVAHVPDSIYESLANWLKKEKGIDFSKAELKKMFIMIQMVAVDMDNVSIVDNGLDMIVYSNDKVSGIAGTSNFMICIEKNRKAEVVLENCERQLLKYAAEIESICGKLDSEFSSVKTVLKSIKANVEKEARDCKNMQQALNTIHHYYEMTEKRIVAMS